MRRTWVVGLVIAIFAVGASTAVAASAHFKKGGEPTCTFSGTGTTSVSATCSGTLAGLKSLILLDMVLPRVGGLELLKRIRDIGVNAPVLVMTGGRQEAEALIAGAVGYLHKPFNLRDLDRSVARALAPGPRTASG